MPKAFCLPAALLAALLILGALPCAPAAAQPADTPDASANATGGEIPLPEMRVVATPVIEGNVVDRYAATTTVVSQDQIEDLNALDLTSALRRTPGVTISRFNHVGSWGGGEGGAVFVRGEGSSRPGSEIKTFVDGVPMYMGPWNHPLMDLMPVDAAGSVEVVKGPQPQRFGNTLSAINITPKQQTEEGTKTVVNVAAGSYATVREGVERGGKSDGFDYYVGEGYVRSDGHRSGSAGQKLGGYANLGYQLTDAWDIRAYAVTVTNRVQDPGPESDDDLSDGRYDTNAGLFSLALSHQYEKLDGSLKVFVNTGEGNWKDQLGNDDDCLNDFTFWGVRLRETLRPWTGGDLTVGLDQDWWTSRVRDTYDNDKEESYFNPPQHSITMPYAGFSQLIGEKTGFFAIPSLGFRYYEHNVYDSELAPNYGLILGYAETQLHASWSRGVVYPGHDAFVANWVKKNWEDLKAETTDHTELGLSHSFGDLAQLDVSYFYDEGRNRYVFAPPGPSWKNYGHFNISGWEGSLTVTPLDTLSLFAGYTFQEASPEDLPYVPENSYSAGLAWRFLPRFKLNLDAQYVDDMYVMSQARGALAVNTEKVDSYFLVNGRLGWEFPAEAIGADGELYLAMENLLDEHYEYKPDYHMPGINGMLGVKLTF